jgi:hypothetical protein
MTVSMDQTGFCLFGSLPSRLDLPRLIPSRDSAWGGVRRPTIWSLPHVQELFTGQRKLMFVETTSPEGPPVGQEMVVGPVRQPGPRESRMVRRGRLLFSEQAAALLSRSRYAACKGALEWLLALVLFVLALPFIVLCALLVKLTSRGPAFYAQTRQGRYGVPFRIFKVRTMYHDYEKATGPGGRGRATRASRWSASSCAGRTWTNCRSCGTCCAAR